MQETTSCLPKVRCARCCRQAPGSDTRRRSYCCWYFGLVLVLLWSVGARKHTTPAPLASLADGTYRDTAGCAGRDFLPCHRDRAQAPTSATSQILRREYTATPSLCWAALCGVDCPSVRAAEAVSLCLASATALRGTRHTSLRRCDLVAGPANHRCLSLSNP